MTDYYENVQRAQKLTGRAKVGYWVIERSPYEVGWYDVL